MLQSEQQVERREFQLTLFACLAILVLATGLAMLMYPAVFANRTLSLNTTPKIAFVGFCALSCLLVAYIVDRQLTIRGLRRQMGLDRRQASEELRQASADLLGAVPNFNTFEDRLSMEFRRAMAMQRPLSVFIVAIKLRPEFSQSRLAICALGDAAKEVSRKLRDEDSIYVLSFGFLGIILPGVDTSTALRVSSRFTAGLSNASGPSDRFGFDIYTVNYPEHAKSLHDLELLVCGYLPEHDSRLGVLHARGPAMLESLEKKGESPEGYADLSPEPLADASRTVSRLAIAVMILVVLAVVAGSFLKSTGRIRASLPGLDVPVTVIDEVEHLPAPSWKAIPLSLPHDDIVRIRVRVLRGDLFDVFMIAPDQLDGIVKGEWRSVKSVGGFAATGTDSYQHTGQLAKGGYYLVVMDRLIGAPSATPSEVSVVVQLNQQ